MGFSLQDVGTVALERWLAGAPTLDDFTSRVVNLLRPAGFTDFSHVRLRAVHSFLDPIGSHDPAFTDRYAREGLHHHDLAAECVLRNRQPLLRSEIDRYSEIASKWVSVWQLHREVRKFLADCGILDVYNIPIDGPDDYYALFSVSSHRCPVDRFSVLVSRHRARLHLLAQQVDRIGMRKFHNRFKRDKFNPRRPVTSRPLELIELLANKDLALNEAAQVLNISICTANQHIAAAKKALGVKTMHGLIKAAEKEGLIELRRYW